MGFFGLKNSREVEEEKRKAAAAATADVIKNNYVSLSNLSKGSQVNFAIPYFDVFDPRLMDFGVPVAVHGAIVYSIDDMNLFHQVNKTEEFSDETFQAKLRGQVTKYVKGIVSNAPSDAQIPVVQLERKIIELSELIQQRVAPQIERLFGITIRNLDITNIEVDKMSRGYRELKALTADLERDNILAKHDANLSNFNLQNTLQQDQLKMQSSLNLDAMRRQQEMQLGGQEQLQAMQLENQRETMRIQREEMQRASRLQTEQTFLGAHQADLNAGVKMQQSSGMFSQQTLGGAALGGLGSGMNAPQMPQMPGMPQMPQVPQVQYMVGINGQQAGPYDWNQLQQLVQQGQINQQTFVWTQGMAQWACAGQVAELLPLFS